MARGALRDVLLVVDVIDDFRHADGERLLASFRGRLATMEGALGRARAAGVEVVYANDNRGVWDGDRDRLLREALDEGAGGDVVERLRPADGEAFVIKPRYSAFDLTPLPLILQDLRADRLVLMGATAEMCVTRRRSTRASAATR